MVTDFYTKPLQGKRFRMMRDLLLNQSDNYSSLQYRSVLENNETGNIVQEKNY
jgi:hypothetical protein